MHLEDNSCLVQYSKEWHSKMKAGTLLKCDQNSLGELLARWKRWTRLRWDGGQESELVGFSQVLWLTCSWKQVGWGTWLGWIVGGTNGGTAQRVFIPSEAVGYFATLFVFRVHHMVWWKQGVVGKIRSCFEHKWTWWCGVTSATN